MIILKQHRKIFRTNELNNNVLLACLLSCLIGLWITSVSGTFVPKTRICFNTLTSDDPFKSECVYCNLRQYANTLTACTGQPTLAANISQAQALCIVGACLQMPIHNDHHFAKRQWFPFAQRFGPQIFGTRGWVSAANDFLERSTAALRWGLQRNVGYKNSLMKQSNLSWRRKKRSLQFRVPLVGLKSNSNTNKQSYFSGGFDKPNGTLSAQFNNLSNGTTSGNLMFTLNRPTKAAISAYIWDRPLKRVLTRNSSNSKNIQWQFGRGQPMASAQGGAISMNAGRGSAIPPAAPKPATVAPNSSNSRPGAPASPTTTGGPAAPAG